MPRLPVFGRLVLFLLLVAWSAKFIFTPVAANYAGESFLHNIDLAFHEAGHPIFGLFGGEFMGRIGGSLMQLVIPIVVTVTFLVTNGDPFGASVGLWWTAESVMDLAPYINDSRALALPLVGGFTGAEVEGHDWENILGRFGWLPYDHAIAQATQAVGIVLMLAALAWGAWALYGQITSQDQ